MKRYIFTLLTIIFATQSYAQSTLVVANGISESYSIPINGYCPYNQHEQFIYPASELPAITGSLITKIKFHCLNNNLNISWSSATCIVKIGSPTESNYASATYNTTPLTQVYSGSIAIVNGILEFTLTTPYIFPGGNMLIDIQNNLPSNAIQFLGIITPYVSLSQCQWPSGSHLPNLESFLPKVTFEYSGGTPFIYTFPASSIGSTSATLNGNYFHMTSSSYGVQYMQTSLSDWDSAITIISTSSPMIENISTLTPSTSYKYRAFANNGITNIYGQEVTFTTLPALPYYCDFEDTTENSKWNFLNHFQPHKFYIGNASQNPAVNNTVGGSNALYISNDSGVTWAYTHLYGSGYDSKVYAYRDFEVPIGVSELKFDFDWKSQGNYDTTDFARIYWMPANIPVFAGNKVPYFNSIDYELTSQIGNYINGYGQHSLVSQSTWQHTQFSINSFQFPNLAGTTWRLYIYWENGNSTYGFPFRPVTIDNLSIAVSNCLTPKIDSIINITPNSAEIYFSEVGTATTWNIQYRYMGSTTWNTVQTTSNPFFLNGLNASSSYELKILSDCGSEVSCWSPIRLFQTPCGTITQFPWSESFENPQDWITILAPGNTTSPPCWININSNNVSESWKHGIDAGEFTYAHNSSNSAIHYGLFSSTNNDYLISPPISLTSNEKIRFWAVGYNMVRYSDHKLKVAIYDINSVGHDITSIADTSFFIEIMPSTDVASYSWSEFEIYLNQFSGDFRIAFIINTDGNSTMYGGNKLCLDDIIIEECCQLPQNIQISNIDPHKATITWSHIQGSVPITHWEVAYRYIDLDSLIWSNWNTIDISNIPICSLVNLIPSTQYEVKIRSFCGLSDSTSYTTSQFFTTPSPTYNPGICYISVESLNKNFILWEAPLTSNIDSIIIYKETNSSNIYEEIGEVSINGPSYFIDINSEPTIRTDKYKMTIIDTYGYESELSPFHKSVHLTINQGVNDRWNLMWNSYEGRNIASINIFRKTNSELDPFILIATVSGSNNSYTDINVPQGYIYYYLEMIFNEPCDISKSNHVIKSNIATNNPTIINEQFQNKFQLSLYPNPVDNLLYMNIQEGENNFDYEITIINILGEYLIQQKVFNGENTINIGNLSSGIYFLKISSPNKTETRKFLKN